MFDIWENTHTHIYTSTNTSDIVPQLRYVNRLLNKTKENSKNEEKKNKFKIICERWINLTRSPFRCSPIWIHTRFYLSPYTRHLFFFKRTFHTSIRNWKRWKNAESELNSIAHSEKSSNLWNRWVKKKIKIKTTKNLTRKDLKWNERNENHLWIFIWTQLMRMH